MTTETIHGDLALHIKRLRKQRKMTQKEFASLLGTSQSAIARIEGGKQNLTVKELVKIGGVLGYNFLSLEDNQQDSFRIEGGHKLHGSIVSNTSKNGAMGLLCAALVNRGTTVLHGIPRIEEIYRFIETYRSLKIDIEWTGENTLTITPPKRFNLDVINKKSAARTRSILMTIGALAHHKKEFTIPHAGGCKMGNRTIAAHRFGLEKLGISIDKKTNHYEIKRSTPPRKRTVVLYEASDTATENIMIAAAVTPGTTTIKFAQQNYMVRDVRYFLEALGVSIKDVDGTSLVIEGKKSINKNITHYNSEDPIESMLFITAAVITKSKLTVQRCPIDFLELELLKLEKMGLKYKRSKLYKAKNKRTDLVDLEIYPSQLTALHDKIHPLPFPGINVDNLPFFVPIATQAKGTTLIHDWMWENRAVYFTELNRLGATVSLADPHRVFITGPTPLRPADVVCPPALRPSIMILAAMLAAPGVSKLRNVYSINRGYENILERLNSIGAHITQINAA